MHLCGSGIITNMNIFGLGLPELIIIALLVLLFFGKDRLPGLFRAVGSSIKELKDGLTTDNITATPTQDTPVAPTTSTESTSTEPTNEPPSTDRV